MNMPQIFFPFEAEALAIEAAKCDAQRAAERREREAKQAAKILAQRQREQRKAEEEMARNTRRWKREEAARKRNDILIAQAVHRAYAKRALMKIPSLEDYEQKAVMKAERRHNVTE